MRFASRLAVVAAAVAFLLYTACATTQRRTPFRGNEIIAPVTATSAYTTGNLPHGYARLHDTPGQKWVLWSYERMCVVDAETWVQIRVGEPFSCDWRSPR